MILRFPANADDMLLSGTLAGGEALQNRALAMDAPLGKGHIVMFALRPFWRWQTQGTYSLAFNAIVNWDHLDAGKAAQSIAPLKNIAVLAGQEEREVHRGDTETQRNRKDLCQLVLRFLHAFSPRLRGEFLPSATRRLPPSLRPPPPLPQGRRGSRPIYPIPSCFSPRLRVSAVNFFLPPPAACRPLCALRLLCLKEDAETAHLPDPFFLFLRVSAPPR